MSKVIGIDLGTTYSAISRLDDEGRAMLIDNADERPITPSVVLLGDEGQVIVGPSPERASIEDPSKIIEAVKRQMGNKDYYVVYRNKKLTSEFVSALILKKLKQDAEARIGPERIKGAYAWRSLRRAGARLALNSDLPATDSNIFYGLHSAVTRTDKESQPPGGWRKEEALTVEEALRGWTSWAAYAEFREHETGTLAAGRRADMTVIDIDPMQIGEREPHKLLDGKVVMTVGGGRVIYRRDRK